MILGHHLYMWLVMMTTPPLISYLDCLVMSSSRHNPFHTVEVGNQHHTLVEFHEAFFFAEELSHKYYSLRPSSLYAGAHWSKRTRQCTWCG